MIYIFCLGCRKNLAQPEVVVFVSNGLEIRRFGTKRLDIRHFEIFTVGYKPFC
jgi:hypothetical protein